jgi:hypothetical protein
LTITTLLTRSGCSAASTSPLIAVYPAAKIVACSHPAASITAIASSAQNFGPISSSEAREDSPIPR